MHLNRIVIESGFRIWYFYRPVTTGSTGSDSRFTMIAAETILYVPQMSRNRIRISNLTFWPTGSNRKYRFNFRLLKIRDLSILYAHQKIRNSKEISNLWFLPTGHNQKYRSTSGYRKFGTLPYFMHLKRFVIIWRLWIWHFYRPVTTEITG